jgi:hypothetical protein
MVNVLPMTKTFHPYSLDQRLLLPPDVREWLPEGHLAGKVYGIGLLHGGHRHAG